MNDEHQPPEDDQIVGRALKISAAVITAVAATFLLFVVFSDTPQSDVPDSLTQSALPEVRELPPLEVPFLPFTDIAAASGIDFVHENGAAGEKLLPETMGGGGAFFDFDGDGDQDIICINSMPWPWSGNNSETSPTSALYENNGLGEFTNVTPGSGLDTAMYANGVACGDYDNDGRVDLYITCVGSNRLFRNDGQGRFSDVSAQTGVAGGNDDWSTSAGWFDYDRDGDLDLLVCNYIEWSREADLGMEFTLDGSLRAYGRPTDFRGTFPALYRNDGNGKFESVGEAAGLHVRNPDTAEPLAKSLGLTFADINHDGWLDVMIANDTVQNMLFINQQNGTFLENAAGCGVAFDNSGGARGAMGIDSGCFRNSDAVGFTIGNFANEMTALYVCQTPDLPVPIFRDEAVSNGIGPVTRMELTFGIMFVDVDLDSRPDIVACNGHLEEDIQKVQSSQHYAQPPQLLWNCGVDYENEFVPIPEDHTTADFLRRMVGRGATRADIDDDGDSDILLLASGGPPRLLRNDQDTNHHWLRVRLTGTRCNRDAIGSVVKVTLPDGTLATKTVMPTCSYQSQVELPLTFGLGKFDTVADLTIHWADGSTETVDVSDVDQLIEITQK